MRKFKRRPPRGLPFRLLLVVAGALLLLAAFAPCANADLLRFYILRVRPTDLTPLIWSPMCRRSRPGVFTHLTIKLPPRLYPFSFTHPRSGLPLNVPPGDPDPNTFQPWYPQVPAELI